MDNKDKLVSVIIPAYNAGRFLSETLKNVLDQDYSEIEVLVVNDGSTDNTDEMINNYLHDKRVKYIRQQNMGCSGAKNTGLRHAIGSYIQFLDADDLLSNNKIISQVSVLENEPDSIAVCRTKTFNLSVDDLDSQEIDTDFLYTTNNSLEFVLNLYGLNGEAGMIQPNAFMITRKLADKIGEYNVSISPSPDEDGEYFCRAMLASTKIHFTKEGINYYRKPLNSKSSLSRQLNYAHAKGALKSLQLITALLLSYENSERVKKVMAMHFANFMYLYSKYSDLGRLAKIEIRNLGMRKIPETGGINFKNMARMVGFNNALVLKNIFSKIKEI